MSKSVIEQILEIARWAPSGDNTQPWRFEIVDDRRCVIHGFDTRGHCVYDLDGRPSQIALGALLENIALAASEHGVVARIERRPEAPETHPTFDVRVEPSSDVSPDPLLPFIPERRVQRRAMSIRALVTDEKREMEIAAAVRGHSVLWLEGLGTKFRAAILMSDNGKLRLKLPEAYLVHRSVIEPNARYSEDRIPDQAVGLDPIATRMMHWTMVSWKRVEFFNTYLAGTILPRVELDLVPGLACAGHMAILAPEAPKGIDSYVLGGRAMQRVWLTATRLGLQMQPEMTPLIFSRYVREGIRFSASPGMFEWAGRLKARLEDLVGADAAGRAVFLARIGAGTPAYARSLRMRLQSLVGTQSPSRQT